jgi:hypothetical protein
MGHLRKRRQRRERATEHAGRARTTGGEPDFAPSSETPGGYVGQAAL